MISNFEFDYVLYQIRRYSDLNAYEKEKWKRFVWRMCRYDDVSKFLRDLEQINRFVEKT